MAEQMGGVFHRPGRSLAEHRIMHWQEPILDRHRGRGLTALPRLLHLGAKPRRDVRRDRDAPHPSGGEEGHGRVVLPRELDEVRPAGAPLLERSGEIGSGILHPDDGRQLGEPRHRLDRHVHGRPAGDVVDNDWKISRFRNGLEVEVEPLLGRAVVVGGHHQGRVGAGLFGMAREVDRLLGGVRAGSRDHRHAPPRRLDAELHHALVLGVAQSGAFAGGADRHEPMRSFLHLPVDELLEGLLVDRTVTAHRRDESNERTLEHRPLPRAASGRIVPPSHLAPAVTSAALAPYNRGMGLRRVASLALLWLALAPAGAAAQALDSACRAAVIAAAAGRWSEATRCNQKVPAKVILWLRLVSGPASAGELAAFLAENPDWPLATALARRAEAAHAELLDDDAVRRFFAHRPPVTEAGMLRLAEALETTNPSEAARLRRAAWVEMRADASAERAFLGRHGGVLRAEDHWARFDRLTWARETAAALRLLDMIPPGRQVAARARLEALAGNEGDLVQMQEAQRDPLVFLERARSLRRQDRDDEALRHWMSLGAAAQSAAAVDKLPQFWAERQILIRRLLRRGEDARARDLAAAHGLPPGPTEAYLEAEFLAGWISLRRLGEPARALGHFAAIERAAVAPISIARGGYWRGRALAALGRTEEARAAWRAAAEHPFTFYGQLAALAAGESEAELALKIAATAPPAAEPAHVAAFAGRELAEAARIFAAIGDRRRARQVLLRMAEIAPDPVDRGLVGSLAVALGQAETGVWIARRVAATTGTILPDAGWPTPVDPPPGIERALAFALMRQESNFEADAISPAGARGLMQLMPATARAMARELGEPSLADRLTDPQANMRLGTAYLAKRLDEFDGALPLALAAYNAGAHRVRQWLDQNGDPRTGGIDPIDWIELIPFAETRNYVMRVIESMLVYRARAGGAEASARHPLRALASARP